MMKHLALLLGIIALILCGVASWSRSYCLEQPTNESIPCRKTHAERQRYCVLNFAPTDARLKRAVEEIGVGAAFTRSAPIVLFVNWHVDHQRHLSDPSHAQKHHSDHSVADVTS